MKYWSLIPLFIWILIFPLIGGLLAFATEESSFAWISIIDIITIFNLVWFLISSEYSQKMGMINKFFNIIVLNIPAYLMIKKYFARKENKEIKIAKENSKYKKDVLTGKEEKYEEYDFNLASWEREQLKKQKPEKYEQLTRKDVILEETNSEVMFERKAIRSFDVYLMFKIYNKNPDIVNTYKIIQEFKNMTSTLDTDDFLIKEFIGFEKINLFFNKEDLKKIKELNLENILKRVPSEEFNVAFKQDRVDIMIDAKKIINKINK